MNHHVIILGAGAAGLFTAKELAGAAHITILEARHDAGGRIRSIPLSAGEGMIEGGAEFIHGNVPLTSQLLQAAGLKKVKVEGRMMRKINNTWTEQEEMIEGWDDLLDRMKNSPPHQTMQELLDQHFPAQQFAILRKHVRSYVHGFDLADVSSVSVKSLFEEWSAEEEQYRLRSGYGSLIGYLEKFLMDKGVTIRFSAPASLVTWKKGAVEVMLASGEVIKGSHLVTTLPVSIMRDAAVKMFNPALPSISEAYARIGFGSVIKVLLEFEERIWPPDASFFFSDNRIPTWWTQNPFDNLLLTGWAGGPDATQLALLTDEEILKVALECASSLFGPSPGELSNKLRKKFVFNWRNDEFCRGAYSFAMPETAEARGIIAAPVEKTLFFAGEGLTGGSWPGTVEAAFESGKRAAERIRESL